MTDKDIRPSSFLSEIILKIPHHCGFGLGIWEYVGCSFCRVLLGTVHKHLLEGGLVQKGGFGLKYLTFVRGAFKKIATNFPVKIELHAFLTHNFHGKKRALNFFLRCGGGEVFVKGHLGLTFFFIINISKEESH